MRASVVVSSLLAAPLFTAALPAQSRPAVRAYGSVVPQGTVPTVAFDAGGIRVILRKSAANNVVAANLYLLGGTRLITLRTAGIEPFLLEVSEFGTRQYGREALLRKMSRLGSRIVVDPTKDWTMLGIRTTTNRFDSTWAVFAERVMYPAFPAGGVELVRQRLLADAAQRRDDPDNLVEALADSIAFAGHPYAIAQLGSPESLAAITAADLRRFHREQFVTSRMLLVVVGDISREHLEALVRGTLAALPRGTYRWTPPPTVPRGGPAAVMVQRQLPTNYMLGYFAGPLASERDATALRIATSALTGQLFAEIRTRRNLTYDVRAPYLERAATAGGLYVSTASPETVLGLMQEGVRELQRDLLDVEGLKRMEAQYITDYFLDNETNAAQANFLARAELYRGDWRAAERFVAELRAVTPERVRAAAQRYMRDFRFAYVGDTTRLSRRLLLTF